MSLADDIKAGPPPIVKGPPCSVRVLLAGLPAEDAEALEAAIKDDRWTGKEIAKLVQRRFLVEIQPETFNRHGRGDCKCSRRAAL